MSVLDKFKLDGKVALVTGSSRGLGKTCAIGLAEAGATVVVNSLSLEGSQKTVDIIKSAGGKAIAIPADVSDPIQVNSMMEVIIEKLGHLDILFNNAGIAAVAPAEEKTLEEWQKTIEVNLTGTFIVAQAAGKIMLKQKKGSIINMASMSASIINVPQKVVDYHASKAGVVAMTKCMAAEWAPSNVRVNAISPGYHMTEMAMQWSDVHPTWIERIPMGRMADMEELQGLVLFLASDASSYMTGSEIISDGGYTLW
ncbi:MAG: SDR family oxidoreductase [Spirochaetales bacterium]|nr:SDR family oxidoreductase [Spirochaetales bacterium]